MELKSFEIINMYKALEKLANENVSFKTALTLANNINILETTAKLADKKQQELAIEFAKKDENNEVIQNADDTITIENPEQYYTRLQDILETKVEVDLKRFNISEFDNARLSAKDIEFIKPIVDGLSDNDEGEVIVDN